MSENQLKYNLLTLLFFISLFSLAQREKSNFEIELVGIPYYRLSDHIYQNRMIEPSNYFILDYSKKVNQEVGLNFKYKMNKWRFGLGFAFNNYKYAHSLYYLRNSDQSATGVNGLYYNELTINTIGIGVIAEKQFSYGLTFGTRLSFNNIVSQNLFNVADETIGFENNSVTLKQDYSSIGFRTFVIPEIFVRKNIHQGLSIIAGYKLRLITSILGPRSQFYSLTARAKYSGNTIFRYDITSHQAGFFFGASYTFQLPRLIKPKVE